MLWVQSKVSRVAWKKKKIKSNHVPCSWNTIRDYSPDQLNQRWLSFPNFPSHKSVRFFFLFFFLNLVCEDLSDEAGGSFCWWQSATFLLFSLFSQFYCLQLRYARRHHTWWLIAGEKKRKKLWAMVCLAAPLHNGSGAGMLLMPSGDIGENRNLIEERTRREMTGDFLACCSPLRKSSGTS